MNSAEQTVTWLITLGVLESPKKTVSDPEGFLQSSLRDGVVLCRLLDRLQPGLNLTVRDIHRRCEAFSSLTEENNVLSSVAGSNVNVVEFNFTSICLVYSVDVFIHRKIM